MSKLERVLSGNVNIGIGLMLESLFKVNDRYDNKREIPNKVDISKYDIHIYNIVTVIRNIIQTTKGDYKDKDLLNMLIDDMNYIKSTYYDGIDTEIVLMVPNYDKLIKEYNKGKVYKVNKQDMELLELLHEIKNIKKDTLKGLLVNIIFVDKPIKYNKKILLTTSYLLDIVLLGNCDILESHTGVLKDKHKLYTKYATIGKRDLSHMPYNKTLHNLLGDRTLVKGIPISYRTEIYEMSISKKWNPYTSEEKIKNDIKNIIKDIK